ncbi:MAG: cobalamin biosynthesis protein [Deltaproteobacteria bacterium]|nr:cobalamin biosynthesis protein [Deltaproteobacteria bacterium]
MFSPTGFPRLSRTQIRDSREFSHSDFVAEKVNLPAVAEPAALLAGMKTRFICRKKTTNGITIALAREGFPWSESASAVRYTRCASD